MRLVITRAGQHPVQTRSRSEMLKSTTLAHSVTFVSNCSPIVNRVLAPSDACYVRAVGNVPRHSKLSSECYLSWRSTVAVFRVDVMVF